MKAIIFLVLVVIGLMIGTLLTMNDILDTQIDLGDTLIRMQSK